MRGTSAVTDGEGRYSLAGAFGSASRFQGSKEGHESVTAPLGRFSSSRLFFNLPRLQPPVPFLGAYSLTVIADSACTSLPPALRTRIYETAVRRLEPPPSTSTYFEVSIAGPTFLAGFTTAERFVGAIAGNDIRFWVGSEGGQPAFVEQLSETEYLAIGGASLVTVDSATSFAAPLEGYVEYLRRERACRDANQRHDVRLRRRQCGDPGPLRLEAARAVVAALVRCPRPFAEHFARRGCYRVQNRDRVTVPETIGDRDCPCHDRGQSPLQLGGTGQGDVEHRAVVVARRDRPAVPLDDRLDDRQAQPAAAGGASRDVSAL